ncbi:MAG: helix-turn-helix transcriptional regulator [Proteobacteria bacterium]|nr:helix-turn-helix transcriptional regulator [Pseudomonadota bacterium]
MPLQLNVRRVNALKVPEGIGPALRRQRLGIKLLQRDLANRFGVAEATVQSWETGRATPEARFYPAIISFLGYDPFPEPKTLAERIRNQRLIPGLTQAEAAKRIGVSEETILNWEKGKCEPLYKRRALLRFLEWKLSH